LGHELARGGLEINYSAEWVVGSGNGRLLLPICWLLLHRGEIVTESKGTGLVLLALEHVGLLLGVPGVKLVVLLII
jgi:hypothetical protein